MHLEYGNRSKVKDILSEHRLLQTDKFTEFKENLELVEKEVMTNRTFDTRPTNFTTNVELNY
jgi:hypothetical protein